MDRTIFLAALTDLLIGVFMVLWAIVISYAIYSFILVPFVKGWRRGIRTRRHGRDMAMMHERVDAIFDDMNIKHMFRNDIVHDHNE